MAASHNLLKRQFLRWIRKTFGNPLYKDRRGVRTRLRLGVEVLESREVFSVNPIVAENQLSGTPQSVWDVPGAGDPTIQGYATQMSVDVGQTVDFKINDTDGAPYQIDVYRVGYYQNNGARLVDTVPSAQTLDVAQPAPLFNPTTALVDAGNWSVTASWAVPATAVSGVYFARVQRTDTGGAFMIPFVVRNDASNSQVLFVTSDATWEAYNTWGGYSLYQYTNNVTGAPGGAGLNQGPGPGYEQAAYQVSYNRPLIDRGTPGGEGDSNSFFYDEFPMVMFLEQNGYDVSYASDVDVDSTPQLELSHQVAMFTGHDEYWSANQYNNTMNARNAGVNLVFADGNEIFWKTYFSNSINATADPERTLNCYKETHQGAITDAVNPGIWTGTWADPTFAAVTDPHQPQNQLTGQLFEVNRGPNDVGIPITVPYSYSQDPIWRNTSVAQLQPGQTATLGDFELGYESDVDADNGFRPAGLIDISATPQQATQVMTDYGNTFVPGSVVSSMTLYRAASGALVFGAGMVQFDWGLSGWHDDPTSGLLTQGDSAVVPDLQQMFVNLLADMNVQPGTLVAGLVYSTAPPPAPPPPASPPAGAESFWAEAATPQVSSAADPSPIEVGLQWTPAVSGTVAGVMFYKGAANTGTHVGHLWDAAGNLLGTVTFTGETASGWQTALFAAPISVTAGATYVVSYFAPDGGYADTPNYFAAPLTAGDLTAPAGANGVFAYGGGGFPAGSFDATNYWVDVVFNSSTATSPPPASPLPAGAESFWAEAATPQVSSADDPSPVEVGLQWTPAVSGTVAGVTFYKGAANTGTHVGHLWDAAGNLLGTVTFTGETASGWQTALFAAPISVTAGTTYVVSYFAPDGGYADTPNYFAAPLTAGDLTAPAGANGVFAYGGGFPAGSFDATNYWVDVVFNSSTATSPPPASPLPAGAESFWAEAATPQVSSAADPSPIEVGLQWTPAVSGTVAGVMFYKGAANTGTHVGHLWDAAGNLLGTVTFTGETASGWQTALFAAPISVTAGATYVVSYFAPDGGYADTPNYFAAPLTAGDLTAPAGANGVFAYGGGFPAGSFDATNYWVDVVFVPAAASPPPTSPPPAGAESFWAEAATPQVSSADDPSPVEVGLQWTPAVSGTVAGVTFYKGAANTGTHVGHLWDAAGDLLGTVTFTNETASGWQTALFAAPISVTAGATYVVSYFAPDGGYADTPNYFAAPLTAGDLTAPAGANGVFAYGGGGFPAGSFDATNYWVDVVFNSSTATN